MPENGAHHFAANAFVKAPIDHLLRVPSQQDAAKIKDDASGGLLLHERILATC
jgi:hypothetical protein